MDYLVFLTGLFLLAAAAGSLFLYREHRQMSRWPLLAAALFILGFKAWFGIVAFALGWGESVILANALLGAAFAASILGFCLSPLIEGPRGAFVLKWAAIVATFTVTFMGGIGSLKSAGFIAPILLVTYAGGWRIAGFSDTLFARKRPSSPLIPGLLLTVIAAVCLIPNSVGTAYDVLGEGNARGRVIVLAALGAGAACSAALCFLLWSATYQRNRGQLARNLLFRRKIGTTVILVAAVFTTANGGWLAHWLGSQAQREQVATLLSALQLGANNISATTVGTIQGKPEEMKGTAFNSLRAKVLDVRKALPGSRFAYLLGMRDRQLVFLVDSEDPANTESFSPPGEPIKDYPEKWGPELAGASTFQGPDRDEWGVWFTAVVPILDANRQVAALLAVDYPAEKWLQPLAGRRLAAMGVTLSVSLLLIALFGIHLITIENAFRVEGLSERLTDAMNASEFDTWECFPKPFKLNIGGRISSTLGWTGAHASPSFRKVWRQIHPEDRYQLFNLIRPTKDNLQGSAEREVRLLDTNGRWVWFMLRGRFIQSHHDAADRLVGTIFNIDERQRSRLEIDKQRRFAQHVMESVPNGLAVINAQGIVSYANPAFIRLSRGNAEALVGISLDSLISTADAAPRGGGEGSEATLTCLDGAAVPVRIFQAPLSESRQNAGSIVAVVDLTAAKEAEQNLLRSRAEANRLALVAKRTDNAVVITDATGHIEWVNEGFTKISGWGKDEVVGKSPGSILQRPEDDTPARKLMGESVRAGEGFVTEILNYSKNGRAYIVHIECQPLLDKQGKLTGFMAIERDITQTRRSSNLLEAVASISTTLLSKRSESSVWREILAALGTADAVDHCHLYQLHRVSDTATVSEIATWTAGAAGRQPPNPDFQNLPLVGSVFQRWQRELAAGNEIHGLVDSFPQREKDVFAAQGVRSLIAVPILADGQLWGFFTFHACDEDRVWESWEISILRSAAANIGLRQVAQNESDALVLARDQAHNAAVAADKANLAKSTFLATMSHEIRTPLNAVIGMASLLETTSLNLQQQDYAETILNSGNFLLELINDILDYSRIESGKIDLDSSSFTLGDLCREAFDVIRLGAMGKQIELIGRLAPHLPAQLKGDRSRIRQILVNLLSNAVKFTPSGFVSLIVDGQQDSAGQWKITLEVMDSGIGIAPDAIQRLFRPFIQEDSSTTRRFGGSGLGLAISKRLAELMGGDITVQSTQGQGSIFLAKLTLQPAGQMEIAPPVRHPRASQMKILVVDDNELNCRILEETLATWGFACHLAESGAQAIALWKNSGPYDLVITDHHMPEMDGIDLTRYLRSLPEASNTRYTLLSSESNYSPEIRALFDELGAKPIWPSVLHGILARLFPGSVPATAPSSKPTDSFESERLGNLRVLIAEDNANNQKVIRLLLRRLGIEPEIVDDGKQAVDAVAARDYDIVLLDLQMPVMDGLEASRAIRRLDRPHRPYIVALTANVFQEDRDAATAAGMDDYLSKPITLARLREKFAAIVESAPLQAVTERLPELPAPQPIAPEPESALIDFEQLGPFVSIGIEDFLDILGDVVRDTPTHLAKIHAAIAAGETRELRARAHSLRGMLSHFGCIALAERLSRLEHHETVAPEQAAAIQAELQSLWDRSLAAIREWEKTVPEFATA